MVYCRGIFEDKYKIDCLEVIMSLKYILSAVLMVAGAVVVAAPAKAVSPLSAEISAALKMKEHTPASVAANPASAVRQLQYLNGKDAYATALLGICYKEGFGVAASLPKARAAFLSAAAKGDAIGQFWGGSFLLKGLGGARDVVKAVDLLESSAVQGTSNAMLLLAHVYLEGYAEKGKVILAEDHPLALRYLRRAAAGGNKEAAMILGDWFFKGGMIKNDPVQAREWYVAAKGHAASEAAVAEVDYENSSDADDKEEAWEKIEALAKAGNPRAQVYAAGCLYKKGEDAKAAALAESAMKQGYPAAFTLRAHIARKAGQKDWVGYMVKGAEAGDPDAMAAAGFHLVSTSRAQAAKGIEMLGRAARRGVLDGRVKMGRLYLQGKQVAKDLPKAFAYFKDAAEKGSAEGKYYLSLCYFKGLGCKVNYNNAAQLAFEAAGSGDSYAQTLYATYLRDGVGVQRNTTAAVAYLEKASKQGNKHATALLSDLISKAHDVQSDKIGSGLDLVQKSAVDGDAVSAYSLGKIYTEGVKMPRNFALGRKNFELAIKRNYAPAYAALADYYFNGWGVKRDTVKAHQLLAEGRKARSGEAVVKQGIAKLNGIGIKKDVAAALRDFREGAKLGCSDGELWLGFANAKGMGVPVNAVTAYNHYRRAAAMGNATGYLMVALCFRDGIGVQQSVPSAYQYLKEAVKQGNSTAMYEMGLLYANGTFVKKDIAEAVKWFQKSAESGNSYGVYELACCYENGRGVKKDLAKAASLYKVAADAGNRYAQFMIGRCYEGGLGVPQDKYEAVKWYKKAGQGADGFKYAAQRAKELQDELEKLIL